MKGLLRQQMVTALALVFLKQECGDQRELWHLAVDLSDGLTKNIDKVNCCPPLITIESTLTLTFDRHKIIVK